MDSHRTRPTLKRAEGERIGPFVIERFLGGGTDTEVWRAQGDGIIVALKLLRDPTDLVAAARLAHEALALERVDHPSVIHRFDAGDEGGDAWLATELVDAGTLAARLDRGLLEAGEAAAALAPIAAALAVAHDAGVVHRDVNPANVLLATDGPRLIDFGHAAVDGRTWDGWTESGATATARTVGYAPPETQVDPALDAFGVGVTLLEAVTGRRSLHELSTRRERESAVPIADLVAACCDRDPARRPDLAAVAAQLVVIAGDTPAPGEPVPTVVDLVRAEQLEARAASGRDLELDRIDRFVRGAIANDEFGSLLVVAPAGAGKSWVLEHAADRAGDSLAVAVRRVRCTDAIGDLRALRPLVEPDLDNPRLGTAAAEVLRAAIGAPGSQIAASNVEATPRDVAEATLAVLRLRPILAVVDDLHRAEPDLLAVLGALAFRSGVPGALLLGARPGHIDPDDIEAETLVLRPLDDESVRCSVLDIADEHVAAAAAALASGNPLHAREAARALSAGIDLSGATDLRAVVAARLAAADDDLAPAIALAAVSGDGFWPEVVGDELLDQVPQLVRAGYARPRVRSARRGSTEFEWAHPLLREVAYEALTDLDRRVLHGRLARRYDTRDDVDDETIAHHAGVAFRLGDAAIGPLTATRAAAAVRAALDHYAVARAHDWTELLRETDRTADVCDLLSAEVKNRQGDFTGALHLLLAHAGRDDAIGTRALAVGTESLVGTGDYERAIEWGGAARSRLATQPLERARHARSLARALLECGSLEPALDVLDDAEADARAHGDLLLAVQLASAAVDVALQRDNRHGLGPAESIRRARRIAGELEGLGDRRGLVEFAATAAADTIGIEDAEAALAIQQAAFEAAAALDDEPALARCAYRLLGAAFDAERPDVGNACVDLLRRPPVDAATAVRMAILATAFDAATERLGGSPDGALLDTLALEAAAAPDSADPYIAVAVHLWCGDVTRAAHLLGLLADSRTDPTPFDLLARIQLAILAGPPFRFDEDFPATTAFHPERAVLHYLRGERADGDALLAERHKFLASTGNPRQSYGGAVTQRLMAAAGPRTAAETAWLDRQFNAPPFPGMWRAHRIIVALVLAEHGDAEFGGAEFGAGAVAHRELGRLGSTAPDWLAERVGALP